MCETEMKSMKALVTGCAGFIGSHLVDKLLERGYEVTGIDCFTDYYAKDLKKRNIANALNHKNFVFIEDDLLKINEYPEVDYIFHEAAQAGVRASWGKSFEIYTRNNVEVTQRLLEFYKDQELKKIVYASSSSVYGDAELPMREKSLLKPVSPYGVTKLAGENLCYLYCKNYSVPTVSLRYFTVYGPRQRPDMAIHKFVRAILNGKELTVFGDGTYTRDFTYIDDVIEANILAATNEIEGEVFNVGGGSKISVNELIEVLEEITGEKASIKYIEKQKGDVRDTLADTGKIRDKLNWTPEIKVEEGIERFVRWYKKESYGECYYT